MIQIAAERGVTHARLNLKPVELGGIEVRLRTTPQGITAQLVADSPEAAKLLTQAADDLRRDLEARDVNLLSLDVSTQQRQQQDQQAGSSPTTSASDYSPGGAPAVRGPQSDPGSRKPLPLPKPLLSSPTACSSTSWPDPESEPSS